MTNQQGGWVICNYPMEHDKLRISQKRPHDNVRGGTPIAWSYERPSGVLKGKDLKQLNLGKMKVFLKPNSLVQISCKSDCKQKFYWR